MNAYLQYLQLHTCNGTNRHCVLRFIQPLHIMAKVDDVRVEWSSMIRV